LEVSKLGIVNVLFFLVRYLTVAIRVVELVFYTNITGLIHPSPPYCVAWVWFEVLGGLVVFYSVRILLIVRVFAFYERNRKLLFAIIIFSVCEHASSIGILSVAVPKMPTMPSPLPPNLHAGACIIQSIPALFSGYWIPGLIGESLLFLLVIIKFFPTQKSEIWSSHLLRVIIRDGIWVFALLFANILWSALAFQFSPEKGQIAVTWLWSVMGFCGTRLVLNLRSVGRDGMMSTTYETGGMELSFMSFHRSEIIRVSEGLSYATTTETNSATLNEQCMS